MSTALCTNPKAANYNPNATSDDGSCYYVDKVGGVCYAFQDVPPSQVIDQSFTLSWGVEADNWIFFHDYAPDFYFSTREQLHTLKTGKIYNHNNGINGMYYDGIPKSFFIDVALNSNEEQTLNAVSWITKVLNEDGSPAPFDTLTHITIWNETQCTGRIALADAFQDLEFINTRKIKGRWSFNNFRDAVAKDGNFLGDIFHNFAVDEVKLSASIPWYDQQLMEGLYFVVRFEFDNTSGKKIYIEDTGGDANTSYR